MSKKLNKSGAGTPKNTLFSYFSKSPAMTEKKKMHRTPENGANEENNEGKENLSNTIDSPKSALPLAKKRDLEKELKEASEKEPQENNRDKEDEDEEEVDCSMKRKKRKRITIVDSDSSEDEHEDKKRNVFADSDDDDADADYNASADSVSDVESDHKDDSMEKEDEKPKKRKNKVERIAKKPKLELNDEIEVKKEVEDKRTILEKLKELQHTEDKNLNGKENLDDDLLDTVKSENLAEPAEYPHQKLEFLRPDKIKDKQGRRPDHPEYDKSTLYVPKSYLDGVSPGVRQWWVLKSDNFDCVLFFKVGKFYELYHMDADVGVNELGFTYMRGEFAHAGFPEPAFDKMASILVERGYKVARVEQTETPDMMTERCKKIKSTKFDKVVRREICQITNRGTQVFGSQCEITANHQPSYMLAIVERKDASSSAYGICFIDTSIGDFNVGEFIDDKNCSRLLTLLCHHMPVLVLYEKSSLSERTQQILRSMLVNVLKETLPSGITTAEKTLKHLAENYYASEGEDNWPAVLHCMQDANDCLGITPHADYKLAVKALGICIAYMQKCFLEEKIMPMARYSIYTPPDITSADMKEETIAAAAAAAVSKSMVTRHMVLDAASLTNLRITGGESSLYDTLNHCCTQFGKRQLHHWICAPSCDFNVIQERQQAISELLENYDKLQEMRAIFNTLPDFERQLAQIHLFGNKTVAEKHPDGRAIFFEEKQYNKKKLKNFIALLDGFKSLETALPKLFKDCQSSLLKRLTQYPEESSEAANNGIFPDMRQVLRFFQISFNHAAALETGVIAPEKGIDNDYDASENKIEQVQKKLKAYLSEQEKYFGCRITYSSGTDKKRFHLEVPENKAHKATEKYYLESQRKGANPVKRYTTKETRDLLKEMQNAESERNSILKDLSRRIFEKFSNHYKMWKDCVDCTSYLDVLGSLAEYAHMQTVICVPKVLPPSLDKPYIVIEDGFHPCMSRDTYIPNGIVLGTEDMAAFSLLTGPNMGGKSTFMRQVGLLLVMAQIGAHIPAERCEFTMIDRIFTRLGAQDDIIAGQSTFMVEMSEASLILKHATINSFVLMDELGRGTATYDGTAIAAAVVKYLAKLGCRTMFSTHYKSLTDNFGNDERIQLGHMACAVENEDTDDPTEETVTFLYKYTSGACPKSYGFNAAKLAGMPHPIIKRAYELSKEVEAIALKRKITAKIIAAAMGTASTDEENGVGVIKKLMDQLKTCII